MARASASRPSRPRPASVKIFTLGRSRVEIGGQPLQFARKSQRKPLELLELLVALGGASISVERMADALWPASDGDLARGTFDTTLHRLRNLIGHQALIRAKYTSIGVFGSDSRLSGVPGCFELSGLTGRRAVFRTGKFGVDSDAVGMDAVERGRNLIISFESGDIAQFGFAGELVYKVFFADFGGELFYLGCKNDRRRDYESDHKPR